MCMYSCIHVCLYRVEYCEPPMELQTSLTRCTETQACTTKAVLVNLDHMSTC